MPTVAKIVIAVVIVVILLRWFLLRNRPRLHRYLFEQGLLPNLALSKSDSVLGALLSPTGHSPAGDSFLVNVWLEAGKDLPPSKHLPAAGLTYAMEVLHSPRTAVYVIHLPVPERPLESYFAALVFDSVAFAVQKLAGVRYFTLERAVGGLAMIGESRFAANEELEHIDHDECSGTDKEAFLASLRTLVVDNTQLDESPGEPASA